MGEETRTLERPPHTDGELRGGLCKVICGGLVAGVCFQILAAVAAAALAISMIVIAVAGPAAPWIGGIILGSLATAAAICVHRNRHTA